MSLIINTIYAYMKIEGKNKLSKIERTQYIYLLTMIKKKSFHSNILYIKTYEISL